jgi:antitoxin ParD1/3/4
MEISIHPDLKKFIDKQLSEGNYASTDELINMALVQLQQHLESPLELDEDLKREVALGVDELDRGEVEEWDPNALWEEVERRHAAESRSDGKKAG